MNRLIKKTWMLALSLFLIGNAVPLNVCAADISAEEMEADKGLVDYIDPVTVKIIQSEEVKTAKGDSENIPFDFERTINEIDQEYDSRYGRKMSRVINDHSVRTVEIYENDMEVLNEFADLFESGYRAKEMQDLSSVYNLDNQAREENMLLVQAWIYQLSIVKTFNNLSCESEVKIKNVESIEENVREVVFRLEQNLCVDGDERFVGTWIIADITDSEDGSKIINMVAEDCIYYMMREQVGNTLLKYRNSDVTEIMKEEILKQCEQSKATMLTAEPVYDEELLDENDSVNSTRARITISYDRGAVAKAAIKYAVNHNPLFYYFTIEEGGDCTNFISQSIWQSPGWPFDDIGASDGVKWYCTKVNGVYLRATASWSGVGEFYDYCRWNDNLSLAGTVYGISATTSGYTYENVQLGDIIQFQNPYTKDWQHSMIVTAIEQNTPQKIFLSGHGGDVEREPLSDKLAQFGNLYRVIHINNFITSY